MSADTKLTQQEYGRIGARRRWGPPRVVRLDALRPEARRLVLALVEADAENKKAASTGNHEVKTAHVGGSNGHADTPTT
jgi:hypothetical protein